MIDCGRARASRTRRASCLLVCGSAIWLEGCLDRPLSQAEPVVIARVVDVVNRQAISKIDLLFVIDNSASMGDKQAFLAEAVPDLLKRLADPDCVDPRDPNGRVLAPDPVTRACPPPSRRRFAPIEDIHVGIITSSLGDHGAVSGSPAMPICPRSADPNANNNQDDRAHLVARNGGQAVPTFEGKGFLRWTPRESSSATDAAQLQATFKTMVGGVGESGCGYEATLEAAYRFLSEPAPYDSLSVENNKLVQHGIDKLLLEQRRAFLRPDSLVAVITISDENDYSVVDYGSGFRALTRHGLQRGTSACDKDPNDRCCFNCQSASVPENCPTPSVDSACRDGRGVIPDEDDQDNLRLTRSKQQYGVDLTYPVGRYIEGFTQPVLRQYGGGAANPLFSMCDDGTCAPERDPTLVFWAGIVGVPWQDIARNPRDLREGYQDAAELTTRGTWDVILGDPGASPPVPPVDRHMIVSPEPRGGLARADSAPDADPIHGHEWLTQKRNLEYACTFVLPGGPRQPCAPDDRNCECFQAEVTHNPLCQDPLTGAYGPVQFRAKAFPAVRALEVLKGLGPQGIVASICPAHTADPTRTDYGYRPAIRAIADRLETRLGGQCLPRSLVIGSDQSVPCTVLEVYTPAAGQRCDCESVPGRSLPDAAAVIDEVRALGSCVCAMRQLDGESRTRCQRDESTSSDNGWCYVDPAQSGDRAQCAVVSKCAPSERRMIRYAGIPARGRSVVMCQEKTAAPDGADVCGQP